MEEALKFTGYLWSTLKDGRDLVLDSGGNGSMARGSSVHVNDMGI